MNSSYPQRGPPAARTDRPETTVTDLSLRQLRTVRSIDRHGSLSAAAKALNRTQPAVSKALCALERQLGTRLFDRFAHGVEPTVRGRLLMKRIAEAEVQFGLAARAHRAALRRAPRTQHNAVFTMEISQKRLIGFLAVHEAGDVRQAADAERVTPAAIYDSLRTLEGLLELPLFETGPAGLRSTAFADVLATCVRLALSLIQHGLDEIRSLDGAIRGRLAIGTLPYSRTVIVPRAIHELLRKYPDIAIRTREGPYDVLENALRNGSLDLITGATRRFASDSALRTEDLFEDELAVICGANHPLASRKRVTVTEILDYDWILPSTSTPARRLFDRFLARRKVSGPAHVVETSSLSTTRGLLLESDRLALLSTHQVQLDESAGLLVTLPIRLEETFRPIGVTTRANSTPSPAASAFIEALRRQTRMAEARRNGTPAGKHWP
jgi:DNA-binding transcriptional LysR family regulator